MAGDQIQDHVIDALGAALGALAGSERVGLVTPWRLPGGEQIGWQVFSRQAHTSPLSIDVRLPASEAITHPNGCPPADSDLYRLHARLFSDSCGIQCLAESGSVAHLAAERLLAPLAATVGLNPEAVRLLLIGAARPLPHAPRVPGEDDVLTCPLSEVLFA